MHQHVEAGRGARTRPAEEGDICSMWTMEEELVDEKAHYAEVQAQAGSADGDMATQRMAWRGLAVLAAAASVVLTLAKTLGPTLALRSEDDKKFVAPVTMRVHSV